MIRISFSDDQGDINRGVEFKLNEIVDWINGIEARLEEYHEIEQLLKKYEKHSQKR